MSQILDNATEDRVNGSPPSRPTSAQEVILGQLGIMPGNLGLMIERQSKKADRTERIEGMNLISVGDLEP